MPHCHTDEEAELSPPPRWRQMGWRHFVLVTLVLVAVLAAASLAAYARSTVVDPRDVPPGASIYYNEACHECGMYVRDELVPALEDAGVSPVAVKDYIMNPAYREELRGINDGLGIPFHLQGHLATFVNQGDLTVLEGHVPPTLILEALTASNRTERLLIHQDAMEDFTSYHAWAFAGEEREYAISTPLAAYLAWFAANVDGPAGDAGDPALLPLVLVSGFLDGLNPCAFAVLLFFVSFLFVARRPRAELARMGFLYIFAVFLAYLLIGLGLMGVIMVSEDPHLLARVSGILVAALGVFVLVQPYVPGLPNPFKTPKFAWARIREWMMKGTQPAAAGAGFLVGLCTFPCSGGIYVAVLGLVSARASFAEGLGYLYLYNLAFVLPLVLVLLVVSNRTVARQATSWERKHTGWIRALGAVAMIAVGVLTALLV